MNRQTREAVFAIMVGSLLVGIFLVAFSFLPDCGQDEVLVRNAWGWYSCVKGR